MEWGKILTGLCVTLVVSVLAWQYYRGRSYPEADKHSTFWPRFLAGPIDSLVLSPVSYSLAYLQTVGLSVPLWSVVFLLGSVLASIYTIVLHAKYGQTVGKMTCRVRVVDARTEEPISSLQAIVRDGIPLLIILAITIYQVARVWKGDIAPGLAAQDIPVNEVTPWLVFIPAIWFVAEIVTMLMNDKRRALHDFIAGTVVVRTNVIADSPLKTLHGVGSSGTAA